MYKYILVSYLLKKPYLFLTSDHFTVPKSCLSKNILSLSFPSNPERCHIWVIRGPLASCPFPLSTGTWLGVYVAEGGTMQVWRLEGERLLGRNLAAHGCSGGNSNQFGQRILWSMMVGNWAGGRGAVGQGSLGLLSASTSDGIHWTFLILFNAIFQ